jgi:hypothetical protein
MDDCKPTATLTSANDPRKPPLMDDTLASHHRSIVGALVYASVATRPNITETINRLCRFVSMAIGAHMERAKPCLRYLARIAQKGIIFGGDHLKLRGFNDANYPTTYPSGCRSTNGYVFVMCGGAFSAYSRMQPLVTMCTAKAEYQALILAVREAMLRCSCVTCWVNLGFHN